MSLSHHADLEFTAGDDFDVAVNLLQPDGTAYDLTDATIAWAMRGPDGAEALQAGQYTIRLASPLTAGLLIIELPASVTATLRPGRYTDALRATDGNGVDTFWTGLIAVSPDPWGR